MVIHSKVRFMVQLSGWGALVIKPRGKHSSISRFLCRQIQRTGHPPDSAALSRRQYSRAGITAALYEAQLVFVPVILRSSVDGSKLGLVEWWYRLHFDTKKTFGKKNCNSQQQPLTFWPVGWRYRFIVELGDSVIENQFINGYLSQRPEAYLEHKMEEIASSKFNKTAPIPPKIIITQRL